jgi:Flp pilus assembly protein TadD
MLSAISAWAHREQGDREQAMVALKKGLQLAPGDKVLLEALAATLEDAGKRGGAAHLLQVTRSRREG